MFNTENKTEIWFGSTKKCIVGINEGNRLAIEFSLIENLKAYIYVNGEQIATIKNITQTGLLTNA